MYEYGDGQSILEIVAIVGLVVFAFFVWFLLRLMASTIKVLKRVSQWVDAKTDHTAAKAQLLRQRIIYMFSVVAMLFAPSVNACDCFYFWKNALFD